jgi:hypothetical protein
MLGSSPGDLDFRICTSFTCLRVWVSEVLDPQKSGIRSKWDYDHVANIHQMYQGAVSNLGAGKKKKK